VSNELVYKEWHDHVEEEQKKVESEIKHIEKCFAELRDVRKILLGTTHQDFHLADSKMKCNTPTVVRCCDGHSLQTTERGRAGRDTPGAA